MRYWILVYFALSVVFSALLVDAITTASVSTLLACPHTHITHDQSSAQTPPNAVPFVIATVFLSLSIVCMIRQTYFYCRTLRAGKSSPQSSDRSEQVKG